MIPFWLVLFILAAVLVAFWIGHTSDKKYIYDYGFKAGYKQGRTEANKHIDSYLEEMKRELRV